MKKILDALASLDSKNDNHWTDDGMPRMETLKFLVGDQMLTREAVTAAAPGFSRVSPSLAPVVVVAPVERNDDAQPGRSTEQQAEQEEAKSRIATALATARTKLDAARSRKAEADQEHAQALKEVDSLIEANEKAGGNETLATTLNGYFNRQQQLIGERTARLERLKGVNVKELLSGGRAPIDMAMARKNSRGAQRPVIVPKD